MGHPDDDDKVVYLEYHESEIRERDALIGALHVELKQAVGYLREAAKAHAQVRAGWLDEVRAWLAKHPGTEL